MGNKYAEYSAYEDQLVVEFHGHPIYGTFYAMSKADFIQYLLQVGFIAQNFVKWYEIAKLGMRSEAAQEVIRHILRDEIPAEGPTHQDNRFFDLANLLGATPEEIFNTRPTSCTAQVLRQLFQLVRYPQDHRDLRVMVTLRVAGEVLVAEQYRHIVRRMKQFGVDPKSSLFYMPHYKHDLKGGGEDGHSEAFDAVLAEMLDSEESLRIAKGQARLAFEARSSIHDQFVRTYRIRRMGVRALVGIAASVLVVLSAHILVQASDEASRKNWQSFLRKTTPQARVFYLQCDADLAGRMVRTGNPEPYLGTRNACQEMWGGEN